MLRPAAGYPCFHGPVLEVQLAPPTEHLSVYLPCRVLHPLILHWQALPEPFHSHDTNRVPVRVPPQSHNTLRVVQVT
jgi:hypothetical protein